MIYKTGYNLASWLWLLTLLGLLWVASLPLDITAQRQIAFSLFGLLAILYALHLFLRLNDEAANWLHWLLVFLSIFLGFRYIYWRLTETLPFGFGIASSIAGLLLLLTEIYGFITFLYGHFINANPITRKPNHKLLQQKGYPTVDVFIPTYNEDPQVLLATVIAATQLDYPKDKLQVWILDDGGTFQKVQDPHPPKGALAQARSRILQNMALRYGARYISRIRNEHAKAGNINYALQLSHADLILILDCDHIPARDFLVNTVPFFLEDEKLFLLQTPHNFVSQDPLERNLRVRQMPAENELFYFVMQPGLDFWNTSFFCGSAAVLRKKVLDELGGIAGQTITEDAETTLDALTLGYRSAYLNRPMVSGLQPETYSGFIVQRVRWAQGMFQIFLLKNPWKQRGITFVQRLLYTNFTIYWGFAPVRLLLFLAPPAYLLFGLDLCDTTAGQLLAYAGPFYFSTLLTTQYYYRKVRWPFISQVYESIQSIYLAQGILRVLWHPKSPSFQVTPKGETLDKPFVSEMTWPFYLLLFLNIASIVAGISRWQSNPWMHGAIAFVLVWAVFDLLFLLAALGVLFEKPQLRREPRVSVDKEVQVQWAGHSFRGKANNASRLGVGVEIDLGSRSAGERMQLFSLHHEQEISISFPDHKTLRTRLQAQHLDPHQNTMYLGLLYLFTSVEDERYAVALAFGDSQQLQRNLDKNHVGKSILGALWYLAQIAFLEGGMHIYYQGKTALRHLLGRWSMRMTTGGIPK